MIPLASQRSSLRMVLSLGSLNGAQMISLHRLRLGAIIGRPD